MRLKIAAGEQQIADRAVREIEVPADGCLLVKIGQKRFQEGA